MLYNFLTVELYNSKISMYKLYVQRREIYYSFETVDFEYLKNWTRNDIDLIWMQPLNGA